MTLSLYGAMQNQFKIMRVIVYIHTKFLKDLLYTDENHEKKTGFSPIFSKWAYFCQNWRIIWEKYSHLEKIGENFLYFSHDFLTIFVSVMIKILSPRFFMNHQTVCDAESSDSLTPSPTSFNETIFNIMPMIYIDIMYTKPKQFGLQ